MENNEDIFFDYVDVDGSIKKAEVLTLFNVKGSDKSYAMCSIPTIDSNYDIMAFIVNEQIPGTISFDDITDPNEVSLVNNAVNQILSR